MRKLLVACVLLFGGMAMACTSAVTEFGVEMASGMAGPAPYMDVRCNLFVPELSHYADDVQEFPLFETWVVPEAHLSTDVSRLNARLSLLVDVPWPGQFGATAAYGVSNGYRFAFFYRHAW